MDMDRSRARKEVQLGVKDNHLNEVLKRSLFHARPKYKVKQKTGYNAICSRQPLCDSIHLKTI